MSVSTETDKTIPEIQTAERTDSFSDPGELSYSHQHPDGNSQASLVLSHLINKLTNLNMVKFAVTV